MNLKAIFPTGITELTVNGLHQWDYGRKLEIHAADLPALVEVHFACPGMDEAIVRVGSAVGGVVTVSIPDRCLEQYAPITAWVYEVGETYGQTIKALTLNIMRRARPQVAETLTPEICDKYTEAVGAINDTVNDLKNGKTTVKKATEAEHANVSRYLDDYNAPDHPRKIQVGYSGEALTTCEVLAAYVGGEGNTPVRIKDIHAKNVSVGHANAADSASTANIVAVGPTESENVCDITETGVYIVNLNCNSYKDGDKPYSTTATIFINDISNTQKVSFKYISRTGPEYTAVLQYQGGMVTEDGKMYGQLSVAGEAEWTLDIARIAAIK